jgi:hypothetical protein
MPSGVGIVANISAGSSGLRFNFKGPGVGVGLGVRLGILVAVGGGVVGEAVLVAWFGARVWQAESKRLRESNTRKAFPLNFLKQFFQIITLVSPDESPGSINGF